MDVTDLIAKQVKAAELLADRLADTIASDDWYGDPGTVRDIANATAVTIDKLMTLDALVSREHIR